jgi:imidazolonepropionase-like amidohydrolase
MLMKVAEKFNFKVNTFTHILEGYKAADKMAEHGVGGSTFSDWWAYKFEVNDAIPYNATLLNDAGVVTAINSDDAEMGRRLNQEAAKSVKYGGSSEEDSWKMVTLNPAILLHLENRMGSIKVGKDADIVIWSGNPLSVYSKVERTFVLSKSNFPSTKVFSTLL